jgi:hypothetical protein
VAPAPGELSDLRGRRPRGTLTSNIVIDTSEPATDTVQYVATDQNGLTATHTVMIEANYIRFSTRCQRYRVHVLGRL